ncbi:metalloregulator ArsR/SmtB family transcription factor [Chloroflexus sp. Y-396-1]|uniref:ArsR/SmtB family transcription factor n=1 Tax=Chloroflexus sp. Y-396-1 TaxID=867845 RepID=UPI00048B0913|nr:metalloregulator ArsR/SmtB family transcription factor [Chloroflexus sp. Y-396-1]
MNRTIKAHLFQQIALVTQAMANPHRLELLDLLVQAPRTVEQLAHATGMSVANTSQHLQRLKQGGLVIGERQGTTIRYRLADPAVIRLWNEVRTIAVQQLAGVERALERYRPKRQQFPVITMAELQASMKQGEIVLLDVRPAEEFVAAHLPAAISIPLSELPARIDELPVDKLIVAYCRGPLCSYADEALSFIIASGRRGARLEEGIAEWRLAGYPVVPTLW